MKKIALITDGWRRYITYAWVYGITTHAEELGVDICLYTFNSNGNLSHDAKYNRGEYSLFEMPDYESFDGFIFDCTNTTDNSVIDYMVGKLKNCGVPVVSISLLEAPRKTLKTYSVSKPSARRTMITDWNSLLTNTCSVTMIMTPESDI